MKSTDSLKNLYFEYETLRSRYEIKEHFLRAIVSEFYENIGQVLSLVRVRLQQVSGENREVEESRQLIGKVIQDIRRMCRGMYPEEQDADFFYFHKFIEYELLLLAMGDAKIMYRGKPCTIGGNRKWILFRIMQEILLVVQSAGESKNVSLQVIYGVDVVGIMLAYTGPPLDLDASYVANSETAGFTRQGLTERAVMADASLSLVKRSGNRIVLKIRIQHKTSVK